MPVRTAVYFGIVGKIKLSGYTYISWHVTTIHGKWLDVKEIQGKTHGFDLFCTIVYQALGLKGLC